MPPPPTKSDFLFILSFFVANIPPPPQLTPSHVPWVSVRLRTAWDESEPRLKKKLRSIDT